MKNLINSELLNGNANLGSVEIVKSTINTLQPQSEDSRISSLSTRLLYVNVPEVNNLTSEFIYNFYHYRSNIDNELVKPYSNNVLKIDSLSDLNARYVKLSFSVSGSCNDNVLKNEFLNSSNINNENQIENNSYFSFKLNDNTIDEKLSLSIIDALEKNNQNFNDFIKTDAFDLNTEYYANNLNFNGNNNLSVQNENKLENQKKFSIRSQINKKYLKNISLIAKNSNNTFSGDWDSIEKSSSEFNENDFNKSDNVPLKSWKVSITKSQNEKIQLVGFIIRRYEFRLNEANDDADYLPTKTNSVIKIKNDNTRFYIDVDVLYGKNYRYDITCVYNIELQSFVDNKYYNFFIESSPKQTFISTTENKAPNPPADFFIKWDSEKLAPMLYWRFPVEPQRDIKSFQIFKRLTDLEPYKIICQQNFNDYSLILSERISPNIQKNSDNLFYFDNNFDINKECIYSIASVDAHGNFSNLSKQIKVRYDKFLRKLETTVISQEGAPRFYPNLYLKDEFLLESINTEKIKELTIYLDTDTINVINNNETKISTIEGIFKINIIDLDLQDSINLDVNIDIDSNLKNNNTTTIMQNFDFSILSNLNFNIGW